MSTSRIASHPSIRLLADASTAATVDQLRNKVVELERQVAVHHESNVELEQRLSETLHQLAAERDAHLTHVKALDEAAELGDRSLVEALCNLKASRERAATRSAMLQYWLVTCLQHSSFTFEEMTQGGSDDTPLVRRVGHALVDTLAALSPAEVDHFDESLQNAALHGDVCHTVIPLVMILDLLDAASIATPTDGLPAASDLKALRAGVVKIAEERVLNGLRQDAHSWAGLLSAERIQSSLEHYLRFSAAIGDPSFLRQTYIDLLRELDLGARGGDTYPQLGTMGGRMAMRAMLAGEHRRDSVLLAR